MRKTPSTNGHGKIEAIRNPASMRSTVNNEEIPLLGMVLFWQPPESAATQLSFHLL